MVTNLMLNKMGKSPDLVSTTDLKHLPPRMREPDVLL